MEIAIYFGLFFGSIATICVVGYLLTPNDKLPQILVNKKVGGATSINGCGTVLYGFRVLTKAELMNYGIELSEFYREKYNRYWEEKEKGKIILDRLYLPTFRTKFIAILYIPLIPVSSQISWKIKEGVMEEQFYAILTKIHWKQVFAILSPVYSAFTILSIILLLL